MAKKKFNPFVLLYVVSAILLIISIAPIADTARIYTVPKEDIRVMKKKACLMILWKKIMQDLSKKLIIIKA